VGVIIVIINFTLCLHFE